MKPGLAIGARASFSRQVKAHETVPHLFPEARAMDGMPDVLASAWIEQLAPFVEPGEGSLGVGFELSHVSPTPPGLTVTVETEVAGIDGRFVTFRVRGSDGHGLIGEGRHRRALVFWDRFRSRVEAKLAPAAAGG